jgi:hypothetical protein
VAWSAGKGSGITVGMGWPSVARFQPPRLAGSKAASCWMSNSPLPVLDLADMAGLLLGEDAPDA